MRQGVDVIYVSNYALISAGLLVSVLQCLFWKMLRNTEHPFATGNFVILFNHLYPTLFVPKVLFQALMPELNSYILLNCYFYICHVSLKGFLLIVLHE